MIRDRKNTYKQFNFSEIEDNNDIDNDLLNLDLPNNCIIYFRNNINLRELILKELDEKKYKLLLLLFVNRYLTQILYNEKEVVDKILNDNNNDISLFIMDYVNENDLDLIKRIRKEIKEDDLSIIIGGNEADIKYKECIDVGVNEIFANKISSKEISYRIDNLNKIKKLLITKNESDKYRKVYYFFFIFIYTVTYYNGTTSYCISINSW